VAFIHVIDLWSDIERLEKPHATNAQNHLLGDAHHHILIIEMI
jgi:hypothetical protein